MVCRSVTLASRAETAELIEMPFGLWAWMGPRNRVLHGGPDQPWEGAIFGERVAHCKVRALSAVSCAETAEPIDLPFGLWTRVC